MIFLGFLRSALLRCFLVCVLLCHEKEQFRVFILETRALTQFFRRLDIRQKHENGALETAVVREASHFDATSIEGFEELDELIQSHLFGESFNVNRLLDELLLERFWEWLFWVSADLEIILGHLNEATVAGPDSLGDHFFVGCEIFQAVEREQNV